jgi:protein TonB
MSKRATPISLLVLLVVFSAPQALASAPLVGAARFLASPFDTNDRVQDGLVGPVRRVKTETAKITVKGGKPVEGQRVLLEATTYDMRGTRVDNAYYLAAGGTLTGKEVYKYDERGNMIEMTLHNPDGSLLSKETYAYEFDAVGNWVKMTTSVAVIEGGRVTFEPSEVTYRTIAYYLDEGMLAKLNQPAAPAPNAAAPANLNASAVTPQPSPAAPKPAAPNSSPSPSAAAPANKPAGTAAAPVVLASLDRNSSAVPPPAVPTVASQPAGAPVVKVDGEAPARPAVRGPLKPVSGGILNGKAVSLPAPAYPEMAKRARAAGVVEVEVIIDASGKVITAKAVKGPMMLRGAAEEAARRAKFSATLLSGQPVKVSGLITYNFTLQP